MFRKLTKLSALALAALAFFHTAEAARAETLVFASQREAVVFVADLGPGSSTQLDFSEYVEFPAIEQAHASLDSKYAAVSYVQGFSASLPILTNRLKLHTSKPGVRAVDLFIVTSSLTNGIRFVNTTKTMAEVQAAITTALMPAERAKLRMVYSTASYGQQHRFGWLQIGFKTVCGSQGICADSKVSFGQFLLAWASNQSFFGSVTFANAADVGDAKDHAAANFLFFNGFFQWYAVESQRLMSGYVNARLSLMP